MNTKLLSRAVGLALVTGSAACGELIDQQQTGYDRTDNQILYYQPIGQFFVPAFANHTGVDVWLHDVNDRNPLEPVTVWICATGMDGPTLASTDVTPAAGTDGWVHFPMTFTAVPGDTYVIRINATNPRFFFARDYYLGGSLYPAGQLYMWHGFEPNYDMRFRTWVTPEPVTLVLLALGGWVVRRHRRQ